VDKGRSVIPDAFKKTVEEMAAKPNPFIGLKASLEASMKTMSTTYGGKIVYGVPPVEPPPAFGTVVRSIYGGTAGMVVGAHEDAEYITVVIIDSDSEDGQQGTVQSVPVRSWLPIR
jgi:hypothetical protein